MKFALLDEGGEVEVEYFILHPELLSPDEQKGILEKYQRQPWEWLH